MIGAEPNSNEFPSFRTSATATHGAAAVPAAHTEALCRHDPVPCDPRSILAMIAAGLAFRRNDLPVSLFKGSWDRAIEVRAQS